MPVNLSIKGVPDAIAASLRAQAANNHRSLQRELMSIIESAVATPDAFGAAGDSMSAALRRQGQAGKRLRPIEDVLEEFRNIFPHRTGGPPSTRIIREMRDSRYGAAATKPSKGRRAR
jgi:plasmid stability protein